MAAQTTELNREKELFSYAEYRLDASEQTGYSNYSYWRSVWSNFVKKKMTIAMGIIFLALFLFSFIAGPIGRYQYMNLVPTESMFELPNREFWFGTDNLGRDYWCQVWYATQTSIKLAALVAVGQCVLGVIVGCIWGYVRSLDGIFTELYNIMNNIPSIIYMSLIALMVGKSFTIMAVALTLFGWMSMARQTRNLVLMYRDREYNLASRCLGTRQSTTLVKNILPYLVSMIVLNVAMGIPRTIGLETTLSYLGLGLDINTPSLGVLLRNARSYFMQYPHLLIFPALIVSIITITFYCAGNSFADACDPKNHV